jgi:hypothetical protein
LQLAYVGSIRRHKSVEVPTRESVLSRLSA